MTTPVLITAVGDGTAGFGYSRGYGGTIGEEDLSNWSRIGGAQYGVMGPNDWRVTAVTGSDRTVRIAAGTGFGRGVFDFTPVDATLQLDAVTTAGASRFDIIVARRNWAGAGGVTSFDAITGTSTGDLPPSRAASPGVLDEQPIAVVQITYGSSVPVVVYDLRCWQDNSGTVATTTRVLQYLTGVGTQVRVGNDMWQRVYSSSGTTSLERTKMSGVDLFGAGAALFNGAALSGGGINFKVQAGTRVQSSDAAGWARITWPEPFPGGLLTVILQNGDDAANPDTVMTPGQWPTPTSGFVGDKTNVVYRVTGPNGTGGRAVYPNRSHRVNWIAVGW